MVAARAISPRRGKEDVPDNMLARWPVFAPGLILKLFRRAIEPSPNGFEALSLRLLQPAVLTFGFSLLAAGGL